MTKNKAKTPVVINVSYLDTRNSEQALDSCYNVILPQEKVWYLPKEETKSVQAKKKGNKKEQVG